MSLKVVSVIASLVVGVFVIFIIIEHPLDTNQTTNDVAALFEHHSSIEAYELVKKEYRTADQAVQHTAAHNFGELLYTREGLDGFSICDGDFGFGCFHTFIAAAIAEHGENVIATLDATCVSTFGAEALGCFHGIGHGLLSYEGYRTEDVARALHACEKLSWKRPLGGCSDGVFMEHNFRVMETDPNDRNRPFLLDERHEPCVSIPTQFREACYFSQPGWWQQSPDRTAKEIGAWCAEAASETLERACFRGAGYAHAPSVQFDASAGAAYCDAFTTPSKVRVWCREGLAWALYADPATRDRAGLACSLNLSSSEASECSAEYLFVISD